MLVNACHIIAPLDGAAFSQALLQLSQIASLGRRMEIRGSCASTTEAQQQLGALVRSWKLTLKASLERANRLKVHTESGELH